MKTELEKLRTRWFRWLGQKTREDKPYWATLLDCNWWGWALKVLEKHQIVVSLVAMSPLFADRLQIKKLYYAAIECADMKDLMALDNLFCEDMIEN